MVLGIRHAVTIHLGLIEEPQDDAQNETSDINRQRRAHVAISS
jgi:hypothetical protein